jgi:hypothetical protein
MAGKPHKAKPPEPAADEAAFARVATALSRDPRVDPPELARAKGFGSKGLKVARKLFAFRSSRGDLVLKLPAARVDALVAAGAGERYDPGHGRLMKEWVAIDPASGKRWLALAKEALEHAARVVGK